MSIHTPASGSAAAAAAEIIRREEEELTKYNEEDLNQNWEFKIVRSYTSAFKKREVFQQVCQEEARAGWILVEKFDDSRIRFKRPPEAKANDRLLDFDPYRTTYEISSGAFVTTILGVTIGSILFFVILGLLFD